MSFLDKINIFKKYAPAAVSKSADGEKESPLKERPGAFATEDYVEPKYEKVSYTTVQTLYDHSNLLKKYIRIIIEEVKRYEFIAQPKETYKTNPTSKGRAEKLNQLILRSNKSETFSEIREKYIKDMFLYGRAGIELEPTTKSEVTDMYAVPGYTIRLNIDNTGNFKSEESAYQLIDPENQDVVAAKFPINSFIYFVLDKLSDRVYGSPPITSIRQELIADIKASKNVEAGTNFIKAGVVCVPGAPRTLLRDVINRFASLCKRNARTKVVAVNKDGKFLDLSNLNPKDNIEIQKWLISKANIFNIPLFKLGLSETGSLNAREQRDDFKAMIEALVKYELDKLNSVLVLTRLGWNDVEIVCPNFATKLDYERARIAVRLVNGKILTPNEAREIYLGLPRLEDPEADKLQIPINQSPTQSTETQTNDENKEIDTGERVPAEPDMLDEALKVQQARIQAKKEKILDQLLKEEDK